jgi:hypothetical protein
MTVATADFSGWATKAGLECSDGRTILPDAFKHQDGMKVPLVYHHVHGEPENVLGHAILEARPQGVYAYAYFNNTPKAQHLKEAVKHGDITMLSIFANKLKEQGRAVMHGMIRELSLVLSGANPGALIEQVNIAHADGSTMELPDEVIIYTGLPLEHAEGPGGMTVQEKYDSLDEETKDLVEFLVEKALEHSDDESEVAEEGAEGDGSEESEESTEGTDDNSEGSEESTEDSDDGSSDDNSTNEGDLNHQEGDNMTRNLFEGQKGSEKDDKERHYLSHDDVKGIVADAMGSAGTLSKAVKNYALAHGIEDIETLFPDAKNVTAAPEWQKRRTEWVATVLDGCTHRPFSRIRTRTADITHEQARAKGYVKGTMKKEEFFGLAQRVTTPTTVYKKQALDRDDMIDITDFDVVIWLKGEMQLMLEEEIARAILLGDGRDVADEDKVKDPMGASEGAGIRSILNDHELYVTRVNVDLRPGAATEDDWEQVVEQALLARRFYKGSGSPAFFTTEETLARMLLSKDNFGRRRYESEAALQTALRVSKIVPVEVMEDYDVLGIMVNLSDYATGTDRGGDITTFEDFDIDYNKHKYLKETRLSGALTKIKSAMVFLRTANTSEQIEAQEPAFDGTTVTIPTDANVVYSVDGNVVADGSTTAVPEGESVTVTAAPAAGFHFATNEEDQWVFTNQA